MGEWVRILVLPLCLASCTPVFAKSKGSNPDVIAATFQTPTRLARSGEVPRFTDDLDFAWMEIAIQRQLTRYRRMRLEGFVYYGQDKYPLVRVVESLESFGELIREFSICLASKSKVQCQSDLHSRIVSDYHVYVPNLEPKDPRYNDRESTFFTGYYTPLIKVTEAPSPDYPHAIHSRPPKGALTKSTRVEIDFDHVLRNSGTEMFFAQDLFELYIMHVEGGGKVEVQGSGGKESYYLSYDGTNKQSFRFISKYMMEKGYIQDRSNASQHRFLKENPDKQREIYEYCPSYVFFKITSTPPLGNDGVPLTDNRSIATDSDLYRFKGGLAFISSYRPEEGQGEAEESAKSIRYKPFSRFVLDQDTGGAIKGKARVDVYWGEGEYAAFTAHNSSHNGNIYFLIKK
ncbi:MAG: MltA domain-containing protein [Bdellovibrionales bacterium]|nr:MltA domain-containing protein [Bdellovibrionales bacterium]